MYQNFTIKSADDLVRGFVILMENGDTSFEQIEALIMDCTDNDSRLTRVVLEKIKIQQECRRIGFAPQPSAA